MWSPRLEKDKQLVEGVQYRTTKISPGLKDLMYEQRLEKMKLLNTCYRRLRGDLTEVLKYIHNIYKLNDSLLELESRTNTRGHSYKPNKQRCNITLWQNFFTQRIIDRWNGLLAEFQKHQG